MSPTFLQRLLSTWVAVATPTILAAQSYNWIRNPDNGHHYAMTAPATWQAAEAAALAVGGHLATIRNQSENTWIVNTFGVSSSKWIGFNDIATEGTWGWSSGESPTPAYVNWCSGEPNNAGDEDGGLLGECLPFGWSDRSIFDLRPGIIEVFGPPCALLPSAMSCYPGVNGSVFTLANWDPDGPAGPSPTTLVIGGLFTLAGSTVANNIAVYDPVSRSWSKLGYGTNGQVNALTVLANGDLVAGGDFDNAGGVPASRIARWSISAGSWSQLGTGLNNVVHALLTQPSGQLIVGGTFTNAGGIGINYLARWSPTNPNLWYSIGSPNAAVHTMATLSNGDLVIGGLFSQVGATTYNRIARRRALNGLWTVVGSNDPVNSTVWQIHALPTGFVVCGNFTLAGGAPARRVAIWNESAGTWSGLGAGVDNNNAYAVTSLPDGRIVVGGTFTSVGGGVSANRVAAWNGTAWSGFDTGMDGTVGALITSTATGELFAAGTFDTASSRTCKNIARWSGLYWTPLCTGIDNPVLALTESANGYIVAGGSFPAAGSYGARHIAMWDGFDWTTLGKGTSAPVRALAAMPNGDVIVGGDFTHAGGFVLPGIPVNYIARWNGAWSPIGTGMDNRVHAVHALANGVVYAGGDFLVAGGTPANHIARWNGTAWQALSDAPGVNGTNGPVYAIATLPNGHVIAAGDFTVAGTVQANHIAIWNGTSWSSLGPNGLNDIVYALTTLPDGSVVAGGRFTFAGASPVNRVARWNGVSWSPLGSGVTAGYPGVAVHSLTTLANGHLVAGGAFHEAGGLLDVNHLARWNGSQWTRMLGTNGIVRALTTRANGELVAGGDFLTVGDGLTPMGQIVSPHVVRIITTCPAFAVAYGTACQGLYGEVPLTTVSLPFLGSTFRARAASFGVNFAITGFSLLAPPLPLSSVLPQGVPGCDLFVSPDIVSLVPASNSTATSAIAIPNSIQLVGAQFHHQMLLLDGPLPAFTDIMSTNALTLTIGAM